ncbi:MAG TPA: radical SAM protein [Thermoplasmata archaeon]|nr:radical SAM protein [Thermoplasmata archaeon]
MKVAILDGFVDEPSNFGVPPFLSPYPRYAAGAVRGAGHDWEYVTIEDVRKGRSFSGDVLAIISGPIVPGKYLRGMPISEKELLHHAANWDGVKVLGGPLARFRYYDENLIDSFDFIAIRDLDAALHDYLTTGEFRNRDRTMEEWDRWALLGADVIRSHPDYPEPLILELDTSKGCVRYLNGGCSFCIEPMYGVPKFRPVETVLAEVRRLAELGAVNFRLGGQADFFSYLADGVGQSLTPRPNVPALHRLLAGIREAAPNLKVLHTDNGDPVMMVAHPEEAMAGLRLLRRYATPGTILSFGLETADPMVTEANNLNIDAEGCLEAIRMVNEVGRERGPNGMPWILPGLNFVTGLDGETPETFERNLEFLRRVLAADLWVRRINIRQVRPVRREFVPLEHHHLFRRFKERVRAEIDHEMLSRVVPTGTVLRDVYLEIAEGHLTLGRQVGTYGLLVGVPYDLPRERFVDVKVTDHGQRSLTAVEYPFDVNAASLRAIACLPGIGEKRAARIVRARPFASQAALAAALDDPAVADRVAAYVGLAD